MAAKIVSEIVKKVYEKANESCVSNAKNALAIHVEDEIFNKFKKKISYRTVSRAFERHIFNDTTVSERNSESICLLCKYIGFEDYKDYVKKNTNIINSTTTSIINKGDGTKSRKWRQIAHRWRLMIIINIVFCAILSTVLIFNNQIFTETNKPLIWYYENSNGEIEYFMAPILQPVNAENLHKIAPYNFQNYMPIRIHRKELYLP